MESILKVGRTITGGVSRAAGAVARGARRILASVPLLGLAAPVNPHEPAPTETFTGGEEAEAAVPVEDSPAEDKTAVSSPTVESTPAPAVVKEEEKATPASPTPVEEKKEEPTPAPTPVLPVEENKVEIEKIETVVVTEKVEVSPAQAISPVGVSQAQPIATPSIIERKTSEEIPPPLPSSPPPTPIDPSPLQQAQQTAANASALAEALKVPAEAASIESQILSQSVELVTEPKVIIETTVTSESISTDVKSLEETANQIVTDVVNAVESMPEATAESPIVSEESIDKPIVESKEIVENGLSSASDDLIKTEKIDSSIIQSDEKGDLVIQSEEGPLPLSEESLVEAKPAVVVTEDDFADSVIKAVENIDLDGLAVDEESKAVDVVLDADKVPVSESDSHTELLDDGVIESGKTGPTYAEILSKTQSEPLIPTKSESAEVIPPLPASPIPSFDTDLTVDKELESEVEFDPIEKLRACHMVTEGLVNSSKDTLQEISNTLNEVLHVKSASPIVEKIQSPSDDALLEYPACSLPQKDTSKLIDDLPVPPNEIYTTNEEDLVCPLPAKDLINPAKDLSDPETCPISKPIIENGNHVEESPIEPLSQKIINDTPITVYPPRTPSPSISPKESSQLNIVEDQSNEEFGVESLSQSLNSYNDSDVQLKERLAESEGLMNGVENSTSCPLLKAVPTVAVPDNAQIIAEPEAPAENQAEISTTESEKEAPASPAPPVPAEVPVLPPSEPAITEDVASVTKAIEETDISDKAVAAAVNEAIESVNANEIVNDTHHQNVINE